MAQNDYWTENLLEASLQAGDIEIVFEISERTVSGGRAWARRRYPFRNGQTDEDTGGEPRTINYSIPLFRAVDDEDYPGRFNDLIELFESDEHLGRATLNDPEFGPLLVRLVEFQWTTESKTREGGELKVSFETLEQQTIGRWGARETTRTNDPASDADGLDSALADQQQKPVDTAKTMKDAGVPITGTEAVALGLSDSFAINIGLVDVTAPVATLGEQQPAPVGFTRRVSTSTGFGSTTIEDDEVRLFTLLAQRFVTRVQQEELVSADEIGAELDTHLARVESVRAAASLDPSTGWPIIAAASKLSGSLMRFADNAFRNAPIVIDYELRAELSAVEVAVELFGDPNRAQEIIDMNPSVSPDFYPRGTLLAVPLE